MVQTISNWIRRYLIDSEITVLLLSLAFVLAFILLFGNMLAPVMASVVIAYLCQLLVAKLERFHLPHRLAVILVYLIFLGVFLFAVIGLLPLLWHQLINLFNELPTMLNRGQQLLIHLPEQYPEYFSAEQLQSFIVDFKTELARIGKISVSVIFASISSGIIWVIYLIMVPLLVYFLLLDRQSLIQWVQNYFPKKNRLLRVVWQEVHLQISNYILGRLIEIVIVWLVTYTVFAITGLPYAALLAALVGISVLVPYVGAIVVTIPVVIIAFLAWGWSAQFGYLVTAYTLIITIDANILVPLLFSGVVSLHPVAIIVAILFFGGLWGFWGVFFAIPLAILVKAVLNVLAVRDSM